MEETYDTMTARSQEDNVLQPGEGGKDRKQPWLALRVVSLCRLYTQGDGIGKSTAALSFASLFPLLQQNVEKMRLKCRQINSL